MAAARQATILPAPFRQWAAAARAPPAASQAEARAEHPSWSMALSRRVEMPLTAPALAEARVASAAARLATPWAAGETPSATARTLPPAPEAGRPVAPEGNPSRRERLMTSRLPGIGLSRLRRQLPRLTVLAFVGAAYLWGLFEPTEYALMDQRFRWLERPAPGGLVVIEIDSRSLRALDSWPWPRSYHARPIDSVFTAGAKEIAR